MRGESIDSTACEPGSSNHWRFSVAWNMLVNFSDCLNAFLVLASETQRLFSAGHFWLGTMQTFLVFFGMSNEGKHTQLGPQTGFVPCREINLSWQWSNILCYHLVSTDMAVWLFAMFYQQSFQQFEWTNVVGSEVICNLVASVNQTMSHFWEPLNQFYPRLSASFPQTNAGNCCYYHFDILDILSSNCVVEHWVRVLSCIQNLGGGFGAKH